VPTARLPLGLAVERLATFDEGKGGAGGPVGCDADGVGPPAVFPVEEQGGIAVRGGFDRRGQDVGSGGVTPADLLGRQQEGVDRLVGALEVGVPALVEAGAVQRVEQLALLSGEADVGPRHRGQPLLGGVRVYGFGGEQRREGVQGTNRDRRQQFVTVGEVAVGGRGGDSQATGCFGEGEPAHASFCDQVDCGIDERSPEIAVVVGAALGRFLRSGR
jgi:hypothetical protein